MPRRRGDDDGGDFPPLRSSGAAGSDPLRRESGVPPPPRPQIIREKLGRPSLGKTKAYIKSPRRGSARGPVWWVPHGPCTWPRGTHQTAPRAPPRVGLFTNTFVFAKNGRPNFSQIIGGRGSGGPTKMSVGHFLARGFSTQDRLAEKAMP